jgi:uncharacterized protein (TIGR02118 family)
MIRISVLYPNAEGTSFDFDYYLSKHIPLVQERLGDRLIRAEVFKGKSTLDGGPAPYVCSGYLFFDDVATFQATFGPHAAEIVGDIPNYTNVQPLVVIEDAI